MVLHLTSVTRHLLSEPWPRFRWPDHIDPLHSGFEHPTGSFEREERGNDDGECLYVWLTVKLLSDEPRSAGKFVVGDIIYEKQQVTAWSTFSTFRKTLSQSIWLQQV